MSTQENNSNEFMDNICQALLHTTNPNNDARMQAENYMKSIQTQ